MGLKGGFFFLFLCGKIEVWAFLFVYISVGRLRPMLVSPLKIIIAIIFAIVLSDKRAIERGMI